MILSILVPTMPRRHAFLERLLGILRPQITPNTELIVESDDGKITIGAKRNILLKRAIGEYIVAIDDDDRVTDDYVEQIMLGIRTGVDLVSVRSIYTTDGKNPQYVLDVPYLPWGSVKGLVPNPAGSDGYIRGIQIRDAMKRSIATTVPFEDIPFAEDRLWGQAVEATGLVRSWYLIPKPTYFHEYISHK